jgi:hypothetical protein
MMETELPLAAGGVCFIRECGKKGWWQPIIRAWARGTFRRGSPVEIVVGFLVCEKHKPDVTIEDVLGDNGRDKIEQAFRCAGKAIPDLDNAEISFRLLPAAG